LTEEVKECLSEIEELDGKVAKFVEE